MRKTHTLILILIIPVVKASVVVSIPDLERLVEEIYGENVESILPSNADPHLFSLSYRDIERAKNTELLVLANSELIGFEEELKRLNNKVLDFGDYNATIISFPGVGENFHAYWLYPENAVKIASKVKQKLSELYPEKAGFYEKNLEKFVESLNRAKNDVNKIVKNVKDYDFIAMDPHTAYAIYALSLNVKFAFPEDIPPSAVQLPKLKGECIVVIADYQRGTKIEEIAEKIAEEMGCGISQVDVISDISYEFRMILNAVKLSNPEFRREREFSLLILGAIAVIEAILLVILWRSKRKT
ncbi:MAG: zinc ABC transporter substrate-binding protein [Archaeoglobaceae archaeon]|nr:zinc ABC transporter substrate-binding protein [Archaeoglobaceae archaeon]MDW7990318.1 zinc ABC transporter substrate-binding protein [Archaeoglobaceae archaeon]